MPPARTPLPSGEGDDPSEREPGGDAPLRSSSDASRPLASGKATASENDEDGAESEPAGTEPDPTGEEEDGEEEGEKTEEKEAAKEEGQEPSAKDKAAAALAPRQLPPGELRKAFGRFILFFLGFMGLLMLVDTSTRNQVAAALGYILYPTVGFTGHYLLLTMFIVAGLEMGFSSVAYHFTTDWIATAKVQKHSAAIRPLWNKALRSGKKAHTEALKPFMNELNVLQSKVTINQLKGMVITYVLLIAMYTWVGLFIAGQCPSAAVGSFAPAITAGNAVLLNGSATGGYAPYNYSWWASDAASVNGPTGLDAAQWNFTPTVQGTYQIILQVTDSRGSVSVGEATMVVVGPSSSLSATVGTTVTSSPRSLEVTSGAPPGIPATHGCIGSSVDFFGATTNLLGSAGPFPVWFFAFSLYTVPLNLIFRRYLKHAALAPKLSEYAAQPPPVGPSGATGGAPA